MREMSIWFFSGILFLVYGILIAASGIYEFFRPLVHPPVLSHLHAPIWWGGAMAVAGLVYTIRFWPRHKR